VAVLQSKINTKVPAVLKFAKFQECPEISLIWQEFPEIGF